MVCKLVSMDERDKGEAHRMGNNESDEVQALKAELERARVVEEKFKSIAIKV